MSMDAFKIRFLLQLNEFRAFINIYYKEYISSAILLICKFQKLSVLIIQLYWVAL